jgi:tyrosyl-tRNA synthetase
MYPLLQGYDSVAMKVDLELGGSDQMFNMLAGRKLVKEMLGKEKFVMTTPLLSDATGKKIGKTEGNVIALTSSPNELYGMIMSLPDEVVGKCFEAITDVPFEEVKKIQKDLSEGKTPLQFKKRLAFEITRVLNTSKEAATAQTSFEKTFQKKETPQDIPTFHPSAKKLTVLNLVKETGLVASSSVARTLITAGSVDINGITIKDINQEVTTTAGTAIKIGKHKFAKTV